MDCDAVVHQQYHTIRLFVTNAVCIVNVDVVGHVEIFTLKNILTMVLIRKNKDGHVMATIIYDQYTEKTFMLSETYLNNIMDLNLATFELPNGPIIRERQPYPGVNYWDFYLDCGSIDDKTPVTIEQLFDRFDLAWLPPLIFDKHCTSLFRIETDKHGYHIIEFHLTKSTIESNFIKFGCTKICPDNYIYVSGTTQFCIIINQHTTGRNIVRIKKISTKLTKAAPRD